jgi:ribonuclease III, bacterial
MVTLDEVMQTLQVQFRDQRLLKSALLHRSFVNERPHETESLPSNERLEFLGDAVLNFISASLLYTRFPDSSEGELTTLRTALVKTTTLADFARELRLGEFVLISMGDEEMTNARNRPSLLADVFEAVLGAIYLDQGIEAARKFVEPYLERALQRGTTPDYKTILQERIQALHSKTPYYQTVNITGPDHRRVYTVEVLLEEKRLGIGTGTSKQAAAQQAAHQALHALDSNSG